MDEYETTAQETASEETTEQAPEQNLEQAQGEPVQEDLTAIPEKFVGKPAMDVIKSYKELESAYGQLSSERAREKQEKEELETRYRELERQYQVPSGQQNLAAPAQQQEQVVDPFSSFDDRFEEDPKQAIKETLQKQYELQQAQVEQERIQRAAQEASVYHQKMKTENQDYARLEPKMQEALVKYQNLINPKMATSLEALEALYYIARGSDLKYYEDAAIERARKNGLTARQEKQQAHSESSYSSGSGEVDPKNMSLEELELLMGVEKD